MCQRQNKEKRSTNYEIAMKYKADVLKTGVVSGLSLGAWLQYFTKLPDVEGVAHCIDADVVLPSTSCPMSARSWHFYALNQSDAVALDGILDGMLATIPKAEYRCETSSTFTP